jgi:hypothetical protein
MMQASGKQHRHRDRDVIGQGGRFDSNVIELRT